MLKFLSQSQGITQIHIADLVWSTGEELYSRGSNPGRDLVCSFETLAGPNTNQELNPTLNRPLEYNLTLVHGGNLLNLLWEYSNNRKEKIVLNSLIYFNTLSHRLIHALRGEIVSLCKCLSCKYQLQNMAVYFVWTTTI